MDQPKGWYNRLNLNFNGNYSLRYKPLDYQNARLNVNFNGQLKTLQFFGVFTNIFPEANDFYEPRKANMVFKRPARMVVGGWFESNYAKKFSGFGEFSVMKSGWFDANGIELYSGTQYRFNKKLSVSTNTNLSFFHNNLGFATIVNDSVIIALRKRNTVENVLSVKYNFNNKMGLTFRARHYWSSVDNQQFFSLASDGNLTKLTGISKNVNNNVNYFNIDMVYTWQFALGSFLNVVWKNSINTYDQDLSGGYFKNAGTTFHANTAQQPVGSLDLLP